MSDFKTTIVNIGDFSASYLESISNPSDWLFQINGEEESSSMTHEEYSGSFIRSLSQFIINNNDLRISVLIFGGGDFQILKDSLNVFYSGAGLWRVISNFDIVDPYVNLMNEIPFVNRNINLVNERLLDSARNVLNINFINSTLNKYSKEENIILKSYDLIISDMSDPSNDFKESLEFLDYSLSDLSDIYGTKNFITYVPENLLNDFLIKNSNFTHTKTDCPYGFFLYSFKS